MAALHEALKTLGPADFSETPHNNLAPFLSNAFSKAQLIVDSVPIAAPTESLTPLEGRSRSNTATSASSASEISLSSARSSPPPAQVEILQKEWKAVKLNPRDNPLGMSVYKLNAKDGRGAWFARRSVHEGLGFKKWKKALEMEFPETMKVQGGPGEGNIRGIGGERRVEYKKVEGVGRLEVYQLSAQFPGPTTPRDFVTMFLTSDQALTSHTEENHVPRHFMVISKPCIHLETEPREGYIRGQYESVEFIREIPLNKGPRKSFSTTNLTAQKSHTRNRSSTLGKEAILRNATKNHPDGLEPLSENNVAASEDDLTPSTEGRPRGKTISFDSLRGNEARGELQVPHEEDDAESNPVEWIMITRSDPGGSVPRFMVERGTPGGIVADASKFLNWACGKDLEDFESDNEEIAGEDQDDKAHRHHNHEKDLHNYQTNGHLAGLEEENTDSKPPPAAPAPAEFPEYPTTNGNGRYYGIVAGAVGAAGAIIASHAPTLLSGHFPGQSSEAEVKPTTNGTLRRDSVSSISSESSIASYASALEDSTAFNDTVSTTESNTTPETRSDATKVKELLKLEEKKRKLKEKLAKAREKESSKNIEDKSKEEEAIRKAGERHESQVKKAEEKHKREVEKLAAKKEKDRLKDEERKKKAADKDERTRLSRELEEVRAEVSVLRKEKEILRCQVGDLQAENTALAAKIGRMGMQGEEVLREVRQEGGRLRASSLKGLARTSSFRSSGSTGSGEKEG